MRVGDRVRVKSKPSGFFNLEGVIIRTFEGFHTVKLEPARLEISFLSEELDKLPIINAASTEECPPLSEPVGFMDDECHCHECEGFIEPKTNAPVAFVDRPKAKPKVDFNLPLEVYIGGFSTKATKVGVLNNQDYILIAHGSIGKPFHQHILTVPLNSNRCNQSNWRVRNREEPEKKVDETTPKLPVAEGWVNLYLGYNPNTGKETTSWGLVWDTEWQAHASRSEGYYTTVRVSYP